jgi:hypothetical protein
MDELLKKEATELLLKYFGHITAEAYTDLYQDRSKDFILLSLSDLLTEYLGEEKAQEELDKLKKHS